MKIIGFGHRSGVGKDTAAGFLDQSLRELDSNFRVKRIGFAAKLKEVTYDLFKFSGIKEPIHYENHREDREKIIPALGCTIVDLWVDVGEKMREIYGPVWIQNTLHQEEIDFLIITDIRHPNEAEAITELGGSLYRVINPTVPHREGKSIDDYLADYEGWTADILNDGTLKKLFTFMKMLAKQHGTIS